ncbi:MAG TPA: BlaI/MecI/CopY family transcriptional regulator [Candidatus Binatia bacterium]|nr:BlaI/MecI/CopY family transcriptional regulator [Candidatus Binatia bacterium]
MSLTPRISDAEWAIMKICWSRSPVTAQAIIDQLVAQDDWHPKTVKTLLNRLVKKRALGFQKDGRAYRYHPLVPERDCISAESKSFLDRVFGGSLKPMLAHFVASRQLSPAEIDELKMLLKQQAKK